MADERLKSFFLNSRSDIVQLELLEFSHPSFSQIYRVVRNATKGVTASIFEQGADYLLSPDNFSNPAWTPYYVAPSVTPNIADPDGGTNAQRLTFPSAENGGGPGSTWAGFYQEIADSISEAITFEAWFRATSGAYNLAFARNDNGIHVIVISSTWAKFSYSEAAGGSQQNRIWSIFTDEVNSQQLEVYLPRSFKPDQNVQHAFSYYPLRITPTGTRDNLDSSFKIDFGDLGQILPAELDRVMAADTFTTKPKVRYWTFRSDDLTQPIFGPLTFEIVNISFTKEGASFEAKAPSLNINKTGERYSLDRFPMLRGFL